MSRWLRRNTTECEREAERWLKELQFHDYSVACMERLLEEITAPEPTGYPWPGELQQLAAAADGDYAAAVARLMRTVSKFPVVRLDILIGQESDDALLLLHEELVRRDAMLSESMAMLYSVAESRVAAELRRRSLQLHGKRRMKRPTCSTCTNPGAYCTELDRYYCKSCDSWLEAPCRCEQSCEFARAQCKRGDAKPSEVMCPPSSS